MCDTFVILPANTRDHSLIFGKNSDRDPNEAQEVVIIPAADHSVGSALKCTYIEIPQVAHTNQVLLSKPFWMWGAEMGANEHGVVIGNEAVFSKIPAGKEPGLIGMDYLRLALERSKNADEAMSVITTLLEKYGQSGNCGYSHPFYYHNSYLIADQQQAWILETVGKYWIAEKVKSFGSISNAYTIRGSGRLSHPDLVNFAISQGYCKTKEDFDFVTCFSDFLYTGLGAGKARQTCSLGNLTNQSSHFDVANAFKLLRSHSYNDREMNLDAPVTGATICMHAGFGPVRGSQTVGSMVSHLTPGKNTHWLTGTAAPCTSLFKPIWFDSGMPNGNWTAEKQYSSDSLWWNHEILHREIIKDYHNRIQKIVNSQNEFDTKFLLAAEESQNPEERFNVSTLAFMESRKLENIWLNDMKNIPIQKINAFYYSITWKNWNKLGGLS